MKTVRKKSLQIKRPDAYNLCCHIPPVFELGLTCSFRKIYSEYIELANNLESGQKKTIKIYYLNDGFKTIKINELELKEKQLKKELKQALTQGNSQNIHYIRLVMLLIVLYKYSGKQQLMSDAKTHILKRINKLCQSNGTEELYWYHAYLLLQNSNLSNNELLTLVKCAKNINNKVHKYTLYGKTINLLKAANEYLTNTVLQEFETTFTGLEPTGAENRGYLGVFAQARHEFIMTRGVLVNKQYFDFTVDLEKISQNKTYCLNIKDLNKGNKVYFSEYDLYKFAAHVCVPSKPILRFNIKGKQKEELEDFNLLLEKRMRTAGLCNTRGFLKDNIFNANKSEIKQAIYKLMIPCLRGCFQDFAQLTPEQIQKHLEQDFYSYDLQSNYEFIMKQRENLSGLDGEIALSLFYKSMLLNNQTTPAMLNTVLQCLITVTAVKSASKIGRHQAMHETWFNIASKLVDEQLCCGKNLLLAIGTPIKEHGENFSTHMFYVVIKCCSKKIVQIMIVNGGGEVAKYHSLANFVCKNDLEQFQVVASNHLNLNKEIDRTSLKHYIYRAISLEYITGATVDDENENNCDSYSNLLSNLYLQFANFKGYGGQVFENLKRNNLAIYFTCQITGNCTIHNLKCALKIMFDLDDLQFGEMLDNIVIGFDRLISLVHYSAQYKDILKEADKYSVASRAMLRESRAIKETKANQSIKTVFSTSNLRQHIASFVGWHYSFNKGQINEGFANRFEDNKGEKAIVSTYDLLTKIIQKPHVL
jgi:hypothetical protein